MTGYIAKSYQKCKEVEACVESLHEALNSHCTGYMLNENHTFGLLALIACLYKPINRRDMLVQS